MDIIETTATYAEPVTPFGAEERRLMYLFPRVPFLPDFLNGLQIAYLPVVIKWGWYERFDGAIWPTQHFLDRLRLTQSEHTQAFTN